MRSKRDDPVYKVVRFYIDKFGLLGTSLLITTTLFRILFMLAHAFKIVLLTDLIIVLLMVIFYLWRRLIK